MSNKKRSINEAEGKKTSGTFQSSFSAGGGDGAKMEDDAGDADQSQFLASGGMEDTETGDLVVYKLLQQFEEQHYGLKDVNGEITILNNAARQGRDALHKELQGEFTGTARISGFCKINPNGTIDINLLQRDVRTIEGATAKFASKKGSRAAAGGGGKAPAKGSGKAGGGGGGMAVDQPNLDQGPKDLFDSLLFTSDRATPNKTLAASLTQALAYLISVGKSVLRNGRNIDLATATFSIKGQPVPIIEAIRDSPRLEGSSYPPQQEEYATTVLKTAYNYIMSPASGLDKESQLIQLLLIYGPYLDKGLSDITQGGEIVKISLLENLKQKLGMSTSNTKRRKKEDKEEDKEEDNYFDVTNNTPISVIVSSDKIASCEGADIQERVPGVTQSILPRKTGAGQSIITFVPYHFIALMMRLSGNATLAQLEPSAQAINEAINIGLQTAVDTFLQTITAIAPRFSQIEDVDLNQLFNEFSSLITAINSIEKGEHESVYAKLENIRLRVGSTEGILVKNILEIIEKFGIYSGITVSLQAKSGLDIETIYICLDRVKDLLDAYSNFVVTLSGIVYEHETELTTETEQNLEHHRMIDYHLPYWVTQCYLAVSYYQGCKRLEGVEEVFKKYTEVSVAEESNVEIDVDMGHDQVLSIIRAVSYTHLTLPTKRIV